jgi:endonuclease YncB( thermonuclease family)
LGAIAALSILLNVPTAQATSVCGVETVGTATVVTVRDGRTFSLADGREARLAAIETPPAGDTATAHSARTVLATLLVGRNITLRQDDAAGDRYGRTQIYAFLGTDDGPSVQETLLAAGLARVSARPGNSACTRMLLAQEHAARTAGRGLWNKAGALLDATRPAEISTARGRFVVVEGTVLSVRESRGVLYINFGRRWTRDFTTIVLKRNERSFIRAGTTLRALAGQRIRIRGWVEQRRGPVIEATRPEQIELVNATTASQQ